jgi:hypothetical protein
MLVLLIAVLTMAIFLAVGLFRSWTQRHLDRSHFAAFVGFSAAVVACVATAAGMVALLAWFNPTRPMNYYPDRRELVGASGVIGFGSTVVAFLAGFFSNGSRRITLLVFGPLMFVIYVLSALANFGG